MSAYLADLRTVLAAFGLVLYNFAPALLGWALVVALIKSSRPGCSRAPERTVILMNQFTPRTHLPVKWEKCPACDGEGLEYDHSGDRVRVVNCSTCGGGGEREADDSDLLALMAERDPQLTPAELGWEDLGPDVLGVAL